MNSTRTDCSGDLDVTLDMADRNLQLRIITPTHIAFAARDRGEVDAFYRAAIDAGGKDFGAPGLRAHYHPKYHGASCWTWTGTT